MLLCLFVYVSLMTWHMEWFRTIIISHYIANLKLQPVRFCSVLVSMRCNMMFFRHDCLAVTFMQKPYRGKQGLEGMSRVQADGRAGNCYQC